MYVVRREDRAILSRSIARKRRMTTVTSSGTREVDVQAAIQDTSTLDDAQVVAVADLAIALESSTGSPVDVECAYRYGKLFLLQCRPITTLR
jgi:phosphoenolpyruvate synthase/pyruvate phosphate dikinase